MYAFGAAGRAVEAKAAQTYSDTERLTWLITNHGSFGASSTWDGTGFIDRVFVRRECEYGYEWHCYDGATPREAIDAAIEAARCAPDDVHGCIHAGSWHESVEDSPMALMRRRVNTLSSLLLEARQSAATLAPETQETRE